MEKGKEYNDYFFRMPWITKRELEELYQLAVEALDVANFKINNLTERLQVLQKSRQNQVLREEQIQLPSKSCTIVVRLGDEC